MTRLAAFILTLSLSLPAFGQTRVSGPLTGKRDRLVRLQLDDTANIKSAIWRVFPAGGVDLEKTGPFSCVLAGKPGQYDVWCVWTTLDGAIGDAAHSLTIEDGGPLPPVPPPVPPNPPVPPVPPAPSVYGLAELASLAPKDASRAAVANNFKTIASACAAGTLQHGMPMEQETARQNAAAYNGPASSPTHPWNAYGKAIGFKLDALKKSGVIGSKESYVAAWREIGASLQ